MLTEVTPLGSYLMSLRYPNRELLGDMADKLSISSATLSKIEHGAIIPDSAFWRRLQHQYHLTDTNMSMIKRKILTKSVPRSDMPYSEQAVSFVDDKRLDNVK